MNPADDDTATAAAKRVHGPLVMPFSNVRHLDFRGKIRATKLAGFGQLSLHPHEARDTIQGGLRAGDMLEIAAENDVAITRLDPPWRRTASTAAGRAPASSRWSRSCGPWLAWTHYVR